MIEPATVIARISQAYVYGFRSGGHWLYVGSTLDPESRRKKLGRRYKPLRKAEFTVIRSAPLVEISRIEKQIICNLKKRGQCVFNLTRSGARPADPIIGTGVYLWLETGLRFGSYREIDRAFEVGSPAIVRRAFKRANGKPFQLHRWKWSEQDIFGTELIDGVTMQETH